MAIEKSKTLPNGASGNYWRITQLDIDKVTLSMNCTISLFFDHAHSTSKAPNLGLNKQFKFSVLREDLNGDVTALAYTKIKDAAAAMYTPLPSSIDTDPQPRQFDPDLVGGVDV